VTADALPKRGELPPEAQWRLEDMYPTNEDWERDFRKVQELLPEIRSYEGKLTVSSGSLVEGLRLDDRLGEFGDRLYTYARMRRDEDPGDPRLGPSDHRTDDGREPGPRPLPPQA